MKKFKVEGHEQLVDTAKEVQKLLGGKVTMKDIIAGKVEGVTLVDEHTGEDASLIGKHLGDSDVDTEHKDEFASKEADEELEAFMSDVPDHILAAAKQAEQDEKDVADALAGKGTNTGNDEDEIEYPEKGTMKDEKAISKFIRKLTDKQVAEWAELEGLSYKVHETSEPINRMRAVMAIKAYHFPKADAGTASKSKSKYGAYTLEELVAMAAEAKITVKDAKGDLKIQRMYTIMALKEKGLLA